MSRMININPGVVDSHFRYKMPVPIIKIEGKGIGKKTVITNLADIANSLGRDQEELLKFIGYEVGAQKRLRQGRAIVNGTFDNRTVLNLIFSFVKKFVLCSACQCPETSYVVSDKSKIHFSCKACHGEGSKGPLLPDQYHKLCKSIISKLKRKGNSKRRMKGTQKENKGRRHGKKLVYEQQLQTKKRASVTPEQSNIEDAIELDSAKDNGMWDAEKEEWTSSAISMKYEIKNLSRDKAMMLAVNDLSAFITHGIVTRQVIEKLGSLQVKYKLELIDRCGILFSGVFCKCQCVKEFVKNFQRFKSVFRQLAIGNEREILAAFDRHFTAADNINQLAIVPLLLQMFNNEEILEDSLLQEWHSRAETPTLDRYGMVMRSKLHLVKSKADDFVETLGDGDSDSDSDSSHSSSLD